jgi:aminoglycoside phosphotransferase
MNVPPLEAVRALGAAGRGWEPVAPGFSGARVWRGTAPDAPPVALKEWPEGVSAERVARVHRWLGRAAHLAFVPKVRAFAFVAGRAFEVCDWMPGAPALAPTDAQFAAACEALGALHAAWESERTFGPCPAVLRRLEVLRALPPARDSLLEQVRDAVRARVPVLLRELEPWERVAVPLQPCVRDPRAADVLFEGDRVSGIVDFGAADVDSPAADLARYVADVSPARVECALRAYREAGAPAELVRALARTGAACALAGWLARGEPLSARAAVRVRVLLCTLE